MVQCLVESTLHHTTIQKTLCVYPNEQAERSWNWSKMLDAMCRAGIWYANTFLEVPSQLDSWVGAKWPRGLSHVSPSLIFSCIFCLRLCVLSVEFGTLREKNLPLLFLVCLVSQGSVGKLLSEAAVMKRLSVPG